MKSEIHQVVHGYSRGHTELAASIKLQPSDLDLLTRLSDLSGALLQDREFTSYLTFYPLPSQTQYVIAQTWLDEEAPRAGCVLTHSLLVPGDLWADSDNPSGLATLLRRPSRGALESFRTPLCVAAASQTLPPVQDGSIAEFTARYFGEGLHPLVWFGHSLPELVSWRIVQSLWPSLRRRFSCCTHALKPRALDERPFDVLFAPQQAQSRFAEYSREHVVLSAPSNAEPREDWVALWTQCVFGTVGAADDDVLKARIRDLARNIEPSPTAIRRVFLYLDLSARAEAAPMAAIGALDVLGTLNLPHDLIAKNAIGLVNSTVGAAAGLSANEGLELLYLLAERVATLNDSGAEGSIRQAVGELVLKGEDLLTNAEELLGRRSGGAPAAFVGGVADAIPSYLEPGSRRVTQLLQLSGVGRLLALQFPEKLDVLLRASRSASVAETTAVVASWCSKVQELSARAALRKCLLPILLHEELLLGRELLRDVSAGEAPQLCEAIERSSGAMDGETAWTYAQALSALPKSGADTWALRTAADSRFSAYTLALTLPLAEPSFDYLLSRAGDRRASLAAVAFAERAVRDGSDWSCRRLEQDEALWSMILGNTADEYVVRGLERLCERTRRSAIARVAAARESLSEMSPPIQDHAVRQWAIDWIQGERVEGEPAAWTTESWVVQRLQRNPGLVTEYLAAQTEWPPDAWVRAWQIIELLPTSDEWTSGAANVVAHLVRHRPQVWLQGASLSWRRLIDTLADHPRSHLEMCTSALRFCLDHPQDPVGLVVAAAFFPVHAAALHERASSSWSLFSFLEWDRGLELRRRLVDAFCQRHWPPEFFVLAACEPWLLRKLCRRMLRQWGGNELLQRAHQALTSDDAVGHVPLIDTLRDVLQRPDFYEDWD